jgi:cytochrome c-type biogenesis protein CcmH/NrfG
VRLTLGAIQLAANLPADAEATYREELKRNPRNGWSLFGLAQALRAQGAEEAATDVDNQFYSAWQHADVKLTGSRF